MTWLRGVARAPRRAGFAILLALIAFAVNACDNDVTGVGSLAGTYVATTMIVAVGADSLDLLSIGEELTVTINRDGSQTGVLHNVVGGGFPDDEGLPGTVVRNGTQVIFHSADPSGTILTDHQWTIEGTTMFGVVNDGNYLSRITLTKQ